MKVTKIDGLSHKKFEDEGKLVKFRDNKNINEMKERLEKLKELKLDNYIKNPENVKNEDKEAEKETKIRRTNLKKYFSEIILREKDKKYLLVKTKKFKNINQEMDYYDIKKKENQQEIFDVLKEILELEIKENQEENIDFDSEKLKEAFEKDFIKKVSKIEAVKKSLEINRANYKKDFVEIGNDKYENVKGENKRSRVYEYYKKSETHEKFRKNITEAFEKLYTEENIKELYSKIEEVLKKTHLKSIVREFYQNEIIGESEFSEKGEDGISILYNQIIRSNEKKEKFVKFLENIENLQLKELTKSQIFYKYFLENEELDDENIKNVFCYFVEIEVNDLLKGNVYRVSKIYENKIKNTFEYNKLKKLVINKLENKLNNYVRNCGKYNYHMENGDIATSDINMRNRQTEAFLRSMIGVSSFGYFSLRNILGVNDDDFYEIEEDLTEGERKKEISTLKKVKEDIASKSIFEKVVDKSFQKKGIYNIKENLKMFYGDSFDDADEDELKQFFVNMLNAITSIRHKVVHYNMNTNSENIFNFSDIEVSRLLKNIFEKETDKRELKLKIFRQLNSAGVFDYWESWKIKKYLENIEFKFVNKNIPFVPSFTKLYNRIDNLKGSNALNLGYINIPKRKEARDSQIYLLKNIYYGEFVEKFVNNNDNFEKIFREIIEINKNAGTNTKTKFYKLEKFETLKANTPTEYLEKLQSLHQINYDREKIEEDKDIYVDFVQKIFLKGFINYLQESGSLKYLLNSEKREVIANKKSSYDEKLKLWQNNGSNLSKMPEEIYDYIKKIKITKINYSDRMSIFYLLLKLIDHRELTNLRGNLEKYESINKNEIYSEELNIVNLVSLDNNKVRANFNLEPEDIGKFLKTETSIKNINQLNNFSKIFADGENVIKHRSFYNIKKYGILDLLEKIVAKADLKITKEEIKKYENLQNELKRNDFYKIQERIHRNYNQKPFLIKNNEKDFNDYKKAIENIQNYTQLKNKIEFNDLNLLQSLLFRILHRLAGYTSLWERDLQFKLKGEFPEDKYIDEIFNSDGNNNQKYKNGGIADKYADFLIEKEEEKSGEILKKNQRIKRKKKIKEDLEIRNYIAHFNYFPDATKSILELLEELRELLKYDRKLKNAVMESVKDIFKEYGFIVEFEISHESNSKKIKVCDIKSEEIKHLKNNGLVTTRNSEDLCELIKVMLEYKKS